MITGDHSFPGSDNASQIWSSPREAPVLATQDVHVWRFSLDQSPTIVNTFRRLLTPDEQMRADRFHFEKDRHNFIAARGCLRTIIAQYLKTLPHEVRFGYNDHGKPRLLNSGGAADPLHFNVTHSAGIALYAFTRLGEIGIDIEHINPEIAGADIAQRFFSANEIACLQRLPKGMQSRAFFNCWTRKEAFIKAKGVGLSLPLDQFDVALTPSEPVAILRTEWDENEAALWSLKPIDANPAYAAAVALRVHGWRLDLWHFDAKAML